MAGKATAEQLWRGLLSGPLRTKAASANNQWAGLTTIVSGAGTGVVSTTNVDSDSLIFMQPVAAAAVASGFGRQFNVKSINPGVSFTFGTADELGPGGSTVLMWMIVKQG